MYGAQNTQTALASSTADDLLWAKLTLDSAPELAHALAVSGASHVLAHASALPLVCAAFAALGRAPEDVRRAVVLVSPPEEDAPGWATLDSLVYEPVPGLPERFDGAAADATAFVYFSSGAPPPPCTPRAR